MVAKQRIIEWMGESSKFNLEYYNPYDDKWHLRLFKDSYKPCIFNTQKEANDYAIQNPVELNFRIHDIDNNS